MSLTFYEIPATANNSGIRSMYKYGAENVVYFVSRAITTNLNQINYVDSTGQVTKVILSGAPSLTDVYSLAILASSPVELFCGTYPSGGAILYRFINGAYIENLDLSSSGLTSCYVMKFGSNSTHVTLFVGDQSGHYCYFTDTGAGILSVSGTFTVTGNGFGTLQDMLIVNNIIYLSSTTGLYYITWVNGTTSYTPTLLTSTLHVEGLGINPSDILYCIVNNGTRSLNTVDPSSGVLTPITTNLNGQDDIEYIAFDNTGNIYVNDINGSSQRVLYTTNPAVFCFNQGTKILCMNQQFEDEYVAIENLNIGDVVKTFKHGYRKVSKTIQGSFINNPKKWNMCMYKMAKTESNGLLEDLIVTGGHSILVDSLSDVEISKYEEMGIPHFANETIDKKHLVLSCVSDQFTPMQDTSVYHYYHLLLENNDDDEERFGIWANGVLTETPNVKTVK